MTTHGRQLRGPAAMAIAALSVSLVTGCTIGKADAAKPAATPAVAVPTKSAASGAPSTVAAIPEKVANQPSARHDITPVSCAAVPGGWGATGTATNRGGSTATYSLTVFFTTTHATVVDYATTKVSVKPGKTAKWTASKQFKVTGPMLCPIPGITVSR